jgi:hypothetical protein
MSTFHYAVTDDSTSATSFEYTVRLNENEALTARVKATADDALQPITDKPPEAKPRFVWDKQKTVLSFEIFNDLEYSDCRPKGLTRNEWRCCEVHTSGVEETDAIAETRAAQMLAEMLGMVCHPEYYTCSEQTVKPPDYVLFADIYRQSLCTSMATMSQYIGQLFPPSTRNQRPASPSIHKPLFLSLLASANSYFSYTHII